MLLVSIYLVYHSKIKELSSCFPHQLFHHFQGHREPNLFLRMHLADAISNEKSWDFKQGKWLLFLPISNPRVQGHYTQRCKYWQTQAFTCTHPQASTNLIFFFLSHAHTHTHHIWASCSDSRAPSATGLCFVLTSRWCSIHSITNEHNLTLNYTHCFTLQYITYIHIKPTVVHKQTDNQEVKQIHYSAHKGPCDLCFETLPPVCNQTGSWCHFFSSSTLCSHFIMFSHPALFSYWFHPAAHHPQTPLPPLSFWSCRVADWVLRGNTFNNKRRREDGGMRRRIKMYCAPSECLWMIYNTNWRLHDPLGKLRLHFSSSFTPPRLAFLANQQKKHIIEKDLLKGFTQEAFKCILF